MRDIRGSDRRSSAGASGGPEDGLDRDLAALALRSRRRPRPLDETIETLASRGSSSPWKETIMSVFSVLGSRPRLVTAGVVVAVAAALLLVPVSYDRVTGHQVSLRLTGSAVDPGALQGIAGEFRDALGASGVRLEAGMDAEGPSYVLAADVPGRSASAARAACTAFTHALRDKGYQVETDIQALREKVSGNVYAMMLDNVIRVNLDGKNEAQIEAEIAEQLAQAGIPDAQVAVTMGDGKMQIEVQAHHEGAEGAAPGEPPSIVLTSGGHELGGERVEATVRIRKTVGDSGEALAVEVTREGKTATVTVNNPQALSDADLAAQVLAGIEAQGLTGLSVSAQDGRLQIFSAKDVMTPQGGDAKIAPGGEQKASWGQIKAKAGASH